MKPALYIALALAALALVYSCRPVECYSPVGINPAQGYGIMFDHCRGGFLFQPLGPQPGEPEVAVPPDNQKTPS